MRSAQLSPARGVRDQASGAAQDRAAKLREMFKPGREMPVPETSKALSEKRRERRGPDLER